LGRSVVVAAALALALSTLWSIAGSLSSAAADTLIAPTGSQEGEVLLPSAVAVDPSDGTLYVADWGNRRVSVFDSTGKFIRAFGWGVVASGPNNAPQNEVEKVEVAATGGSFTLRFVQNSEEPVGVLIKQETGQIPFNASAATVQAALEAMAAFEPGDVVVTGSDGGPWTIEFTGAFADMDLHVLEEGSASALTGGAAKLNISTLQDGGSYEVCEPEAGDVCRAGQRGVHAGQLSPTNIAVDPTTHDVYVFDGLETFSYNEEPNNRVQKFTSEGDFVYMLGGGVNLDTGEDICTEASGDTCGRGEKGTGTGEFNAQRSSVAIGPGGVLYVNDRGRVQKFDVSSGAFLGQVSLPEEVTPNYLAVDSNGDIYVVVVGQVRKYSPTGTLLFSIPLSNISALAVDDEDRLYVTDLTSGNFGISRFASDGSPEVVFYSEGGRRATAVAPTPAGDGVYTVEPVTEIESLLNLIPLPPAGPVVYPDPDSVFADPIGNVKATLHAEINPEGKATTFHFEYVEQEVFEAEGWSSPEVQETAESSSIGSDFKLHSATAEATGLTPETVYRYRAIATNADAPGGRPGPEKTFETEPPLKFGPLWTTGVGADAATLHAEVNPFGFPATGYFEYVDDATYQVSGFASATRTPAAPSELEFGGGEEFVERSAPALGLEPGTTYHYRLVAKDNCKPDEPSVVCTFQSAEETFRTFPPPREEDCPANEAFRQGTPSRFLPDCRAYEMVSPVEKNSVNIEVVFNSFNYLAELNQSSLDGEKISYSAYRAFAEPESAPYSSQYLATRMSSGWSNDSISPPREGPTLFTTAGLDYQFKAFTGDLCYGWPVQDTPLLLAPGAAEGYGNLYRRDNCEPGEGAYEPITIKEPLDDPLVYEYFPELQGFSSDTSRVFFAVGGQLTPESRPGSVSQVYETSNGTLRPVCVLPEGNITQSGCTLGYRTDAGNERNSNIATAVSEDGSIAYWTNAPVKEGPLYVRIGDEEKTVLIQPQDSRFWLAARDGSKAIYTLGEKLFEFDLATKSSKQIAEGVRGLAGASEDASRIYFASTKKLTDGATAGQLNLYRYAGGSFQLVGTLADADLLQDRPSPVALRPYLRTSRVTPDGERLLFMSKASLTGYDNTDAVSGERDSEVFLYDATANGGVGELRCVSCNPSGGRPIGQAWAIGDYPGGWAAAFIPGWQTQFHPSRVITPDGSRVFFNSFDALVSQDTNDELDVYQWETVGSGDCEETGSDYVPSAAGCVNLISSGDSDEPSEFVDSSASGDDVFFKTHSSLVSQDPGLVDIYDARVDGGFPPPPPPPQPECEGESCMGPAPPSPSTRPTPQSQTFVGPGDPVVKPKPKPRKCPKGKHRVKRKGKVICVKNKKRSQKRNGRRAGR
jgi:hypothetical protein